MTLSKVVTAIRTPEWILIGYFAYVAILPPFLSHRPNLHRQPIPIACFAFLLQLGLAWGEEKTKYQLHFSRIRDWIPLPLTLLAFQEMEIFLPSKFDHRFEAAWIHQDVQFLGHWHVRETIEALGSALPFYLEFCYLLVYGLTAFCLTLLYVRKERRSVSSFLTFYLAGTLGAYALFPFFPSEPPRLLYPATLMPSVTTWVRVFNLWILKKATIHIGVFPSAHVSSAFSAAWGMFFVLRDKRIGWALLLYAFSVSLATIYGRYHYTADVMAGIGLSVATGIVCAVMLPRGRSAT